MEAQKPTAGKFALNYGLILGLIMVVIAVVMYVTGMALDGTQWPIYLYYIIFPVVIILGISQFKKANASSLTLGEGLKVGLAIAVISALIYAVYVIIFNYVIDPEFISQSMEVAKDKLLENPDITEQQAEQAMKMIEAMSNPMLGSAAWIAFSSFFGLIYSLIGGLAMKSN